MTTITPTQQLASLALAAVLTTVLLFSLGAQADTQHAVAMAAAEANSQQLCVAPQRAARS